MAVKTEVKLSNLSYAILYVPDAAKALPFYQDKLGMTVKLNDEGWIELESGPCTLALHSTDELDSHKERSAMPTMVFQVENIQEAYDSLKAKGIEFSKEPHEVCSTPDHTGLSADFKDPWGNSLSIFGMVPKAK
ncbi:MAG: VOC family protein [Cyanobacteriota/Melainabacteria group bacterium]